ncbi:unnamed protein product, partial [Ectocarpus sp. 12 AP-2014]
SFWHSLVSLLRFYDRNPPKRHRPPIPGYASPTMAAGRRRRRGEKRQHEEDEGGGGSGASTATSPTQQLQPQPQPQLHPSRSSATYCAWTLIMLCFARAHRGASKERGNLIQKRKKLTKA